MEEAKWELGLPWGKGKLGFGPLGMKFLPAECMGFDKSAVSRIREIQREISHPLYNLYQSV